MDMFQGLPSRNPGVNRFATGEPALCHVVFPPPMTPVQWRGRLPGTWLFRLQTLASPVSLLGVPAGRRRELVSSREANVRQKVAKVVHPSPTPTKRMGHLTAKV